MMQIDRPSTPSLAPLPGPPTSNGLAPAPFVGPAPAAPPSRRRRGRWLFLLVGVLIVAGVAAIVAPRLLQPTATPDAALTQTPAVAQKLTARGELHPIAEAQIGTLTGGVIQSINVEVGQAVGQEHEVARIRGSAGTEVLTTPWNGTLTGIPVHTGDTVLAGTTIATIGDLRRLQVETTDVDEFVIAHVERGQTVTVSVDALEGRVFVGTVRTVSLQQLPNKDGDEQYPVVIDLSAPAASLRPGMSVRVDFAPQTAETP